MNKKLVGIGIAIITAGLIIKAVTKCLKDDEEQNSEDNDNIIDTEETE